MPADYYIVVRRLASGASVPACSGESGRIVFAADDAPELRMHDHESADWLLRTAQLRMRHYPEIPMDLSIVKVTEVEGYAE